MTAVTYSSICLTRASAYVREHMQPSLCVHVLTWKLTCHHADVFWFLQDLTLAEKMQRYKNFKRTAKIMANPMFTFAACGFAFAAADCSMQNYLGRDSTLNGIMGGIAAGSVLGLKTNSAFNAVKYSALFGGGSCRRFHYRCYWRF